MYHSFIEPSVAKEHDIGTTLYDDYIFDYYCFGSDAQAIKIVAYDSKHNFLKRYKTVVYHGSGGKTIDFRQMDTVKQRILEGDPAKAMYWEIFAIEGGIFLGWSNGKNAESPDLEKYPENRTFSYDTLDKGTTIHLYAVWTFYKFGPNDTTLTLQNTSEQTYSIAEITIDPDITLTNNPSLGNRMIVKFED